MLGHDSKFMGKITGLLISVAARDEPVLPGLSKGIPAQLQSSPKAKKLLLLLPGSRWQGLANIFQSSHSGTPRPRQLQS